MRPVNSGSSRIVIFSRMNRIHFLSYFKCVIYTVQIVIIVVDVESVLIRCRTHAAGDNVRSHRLAATYWIYLGRDNRRTEIGGNRAALERRLALQAIQTTLVRVMLYVASYAAWILASGAARG